MLKIYDLQYESKCDTAVSLGYFDGVHIGHKFLIDTMAKYAQKNFLNKAIFTFTKSISLLHKGKDILNQEQKVNEINKYDIDLFYSPDFLSFSQFTPREFFENIIVKAMRAKAVFCGSDFRFGKDRKGDVEILKTLCEEKGIHFEIVPTVKIDDEVVSSTLIRNALEIGDIKKANKLLGYNYYVDFTVVHGKKLGRTIGTPTINQIYPEFMCMPKRGVYNTIATVNGKVYPASTGISTRPTVKGDSITCETFILGFEGDLYGQNIKVEFFDFSTEIKKYDSLELLSEMITSVAIKSKEYIK